MWVEQHEGVVVVRADEEMRRGAAVPTRHALEVREPEARLDARAVLRGVEPVEAEPPADEENHGPRTGGELLLDLRPEDRPVLEHNARHAVQRARQRWRVASLRDELEEVAGSPRGGRRPEPGRGRLPEELLPCIDQAVQGEGRLGRVQEAGDNVEVGRRLRKVAIPAVTPVPAQEDVDEALREHHLLDAQHATPAAVGVEFLPADELERRRNARAIA
mmetsp:Transcript_12573/g.36124  ORF Transcript_12573/g.36124 Transcript_12573/m.36124 type:complete len:218 (+) Transcript_12573:151-804(+)